MWRKSFESSNFIHRQEPQGISHICGQKALLSGPQCGPEIVLASPMQRASTKFVPRGVPHWERLPDPSNYMMLSHWLRAARGERGLPVDSRDPIRGTCQLTALCMADFAWGVVWEVPLPDCPSGLKCLSVDWWKMSTVWMSVLLTYLCEFIFLQSNLFLVFIMWPCKIGPEIRCVNGVEEGDLPLIMM